MSERMSAKPSWLTTVSCAVAMSACAPSWGSLIADGLTYTLLESTTNTPTIDQFTLEISGINGPGDTEHGGRYGVLDFAFNQPSPPGSVVTGSLTGFTFLMGGLNSSGCNMTGNFYCFQNQSSPGSVLPSNSQLTFTFDVTVANAGDWVGYKPGFKIDWAGTSNNYDLVSKQLSPTVVPLPATLPLLLGGIAGLGFMRRRRAA